MPSIRVHKPNGALFFDIRYEDERCREYTLLPDSPANRKKLEKVLSKIESEIADGSFDYANYFPNSKTLKRLDRASHAAAVGVSPVEQAPVVALPVVDVEVHALAGAVDRIAAGIQELALVIDLLVEGSGLGDGHAADPDVLKPFRSRDPDQKRRG